MRSRSPIIGVCCKDRSTSLMFSPCTISIPWSRSASIQPSIRVALSGHLRIGSNCILAWIKRIEGIVNLRGCINLARGSWAIDPTRSPSLGSFPLWVASFQRSRSTTRGEGLLLESLVRVSTLFNRFYRWRGGWMRIPKETKRTLWAAVSRRWRDVFPKILSLPMETSITLSLEVVRLWIVFRTWGRRCLLIRALWRRLSNWKNRSDIYTI
jgi:hypothetical protein